jgi:hypothetical protein
MCLRFLVKDAADAAIEKKLAETKLELDHKQEFRRQPSAVGEGLA